MNHLKHAIDQAAQHALDATSLLNQQVYNELKKVAHRLMLKESESHTLSPTDLVHEVYAKLSDNNTQFHNSKHFFCVVAKQMRWFLVDHARHKSTTKKGGDQSSILYTDSLGLTTNPELDFAVISEAIEALKLMDERSMEAIELCYFAALSRVQAAQALGISVATLERDVRFGRAFISEYIHNVSE